MSASAFIHISMDFITKDLAGANLTDAVQTDLVEQFITQLGANR